MAPEDNSGARPAGPVVLRIKLRYDDVNAMVQRFASNVGKSGLFLPTKSIQPIGTEVKFELRLSNDVPVLVGLGRVKHAKPPDPANPRAAFGMAIELMRVSREGREVIIRMIERRRVLGLPDVAIPFPEDVDAAKRAEIESQPRADTGGIVRDAMAQVVSAPVAEQVLQASGPVSGPIGIAREPSLPVSAPIVGEPSIPVPVLAPEKSRPKRPRPQDLIAKASELSGPMSTVPPELDMQVDIESVLSRARALAGGDLEIELAALREAAATPIEVSVEAASAELARQLGGQPIAKRERSARWEPPPPVEMRRESPPAPDYSEKTRAETEASPSAVVAAVVDAATSVAEPIEESPSVVPQEAYVLRKSGQLSVEYPDETSGVYESVANDEQARTPTGDDEYASAHRAFGPRNEVITEPQQNQLMIDDDADVSSFERALDAARIHTGVSPVAPARADDKDFPADERTQIGAPIGESSFGIHYPGMSDQLAEQLDQQLESMDQEISDMDVLAEADEDDEDLLSSHGEAEVSGRHEAPPVDEPPLRSSFEDFASRLDLGDDEDEPAVHESFEQQAVRQAEEAEFDRQAAREFDAQPGYIPPEEQYLQERERERHARHRRDSDSGSYTFAENYPQAGLQFSPQEGGEDFDEPHNYAPQPTAAPRRARRPSEVEQALADLPSTPPPKQPPSEDLEDALAALDVDLGDIAPNQRRPRRPTPSSSSASRPLPGLPMERPREPSTPNRAPAPAPRATAHTVQRQPQPAPAPQPAAPRPANPTGPARTAKPPPIPAAARMKPPTQPAPVVRPAPKRAPTDDGIMIDFDDDE